VPTSTLGMVQVITTPGPSRPSGSAASRIVWSISSSVRHV